MSKIRKVDAVAITEASNDNVILTIREDSGYADQYVLETREVKHMFSEFGTVLKEIGGDNE